jgi:predicted nucleic acid-binding protein
LRVFADTFYWIALTDSTDQAHECAARIDDEIVTTDEVLSEYLTFFSAAPGFLRSEVVAAVEDILRDPGVKVIPQTRDSFLSGVRLYRDRPDKGYSLTDCISMQTMRREGLTHALTNDRHFEQEGFHAVLRTV